MTEIRTDPRVAVRGRPLVRALIPAVLLGLYAFLPGHPSGLLPGPPWQEVGAVVSAVLLAGVLLKFAFHSTPPSPWIGLLLGVLIASRVLLSFALIPDGWSSSFFVHQAGTVERIERVGPRASDGGVIDRRMAFSERSAAFQFLNDGVLSPGGAAATRDVTLEMRARSYLLLSEDSRINLGLASQPPVSVFVDGERVEPAAATAMPLPAGVHELSLGYMKAFGEYPRIELSVRNERGGAMRVFAERPTARQLSRDGFARAALRLLDLLAVAAALAWLWPSLVEMTAAIRHAPRPRLAGLAQSRMLLVAAPLLLFALHGLFAATARGDLTVFLVGDDMRAYADYGRQIAVHGPLMNFGRPLFSGEPFFFYPLYPYLVALTHQLFDESFYGLVFFQFVLLGAMISIMAWFAWQMFGQRVAWITLVILAVLAELDFARYYTVSVFTDNLYYPLVALAVACMWRMERSTSRSAAVVAGLAGGVATLARPSMLLVLPLYVVWRLRSGAERTSRHRQTEMAVFVASWMAMVGLATLRNWLVSGRFVLLAESSLQIIYCLTPEGVNYKDYMPNLRPSVLESVGGALKMFRDHPAGVLLVEARKLAFSFGFTNVTPGVRLHPEFVALTVGYAAWLVQAGRRGVEAAAVHITVLGHVAAFLASTPAAYGYKTILTLMMLMVPFTAALLASFVRLGRGVPMKAAPLPSS